MQSRYKEILVTAERRYYRPRPPEGEQLIILSNISIGPTIKKIYNTGTSMNTVMQSSFRNLIPNKFFRLYSELCQFSFPYNRLLQFDMQLQNEDD